MKITLAEALPLKSMISRRIQELLKERNRVAFAEAEKGEEYEKPARTIEEVTKELNQTREDYLELMALIAKKNIENKVVWDGKEITILEAIEKAHQLRAEAQELHKFGSSKKQELKNTPWNNKTIYVHALFDPEEYRKKALKLERVAQRLSNEVEKKNHHIEFEFPPASRYLE